jgi:hypothetical protein
LSRALPGAITLALGILTIFVLHKTPLASELGFIGADGKDTNQYYALMTMALTFIGLVMLYRICQPFNAWRTVLFVVSLALCVLVLAVPFFTEFIFQNWGKVDFEIQHWLLLIILVQASLPMSGGLTKFFGMFNPAD